MRELTERHLYPCFIERKREAVCYEPSERDVHVRQRKLRGLRKAVTQGTGARACAVGAYTELASIEATQGSAALCCAAGAL